MKMSLMAGCALLFAANAFANDLQPYPGASDIAPPMVLSGTYDSIHESGKGPKIDPQKGYRIEDLGAGAFMVTEGVYQMMMLRTDAGLVLVDAPPPSANTFLKPQKRLRRAAGSPT
jgi:hypothetical protein